MGLLSWGFYYYFEGFYYGHLWKVQFQLFVISQLFLSGLQIFQVQSVNYESYFKDFEICEQFLNIIGYFPLSYAGKLISTGSHYFSYFFGPIIVKFLLIAKLFNVFSFRASSILNIKYAFSFFWSLNCTMLVCKLYISIQIALGFWSLLTLEVFHNGIF